MSLVSVVIVTKRKLYMNIYNNFFKQKYPNKELIVIINNNKHNIEEIEELFNKYSLKNYRIFKLNDSITLGECYNFAISKMNGDYFCKMDDDYYGDKYLLNSIFLINKSNADVIGKNRYMLCDINKDKLYIKNGKSYNFVDFVLGPTLIIKKYVLKRLNLII